MMPYILICGSIISMYNWISGVGNILLANLAATIKINISSLMLHRYFKIKMFRKSICICTVTNDNNKLRQPEANPLKPPTKLQPNWVVHYSGGLGIPSKKQQYIKRHCPNRTEGGQPHFKRLKRNDF